MVAQALVLVEQEALLAVDLVVEVLVPQVLVQPAVAVLVLALDQVASVLDFEATHQAMPDQATLPELSSGHPELELDRWDQEIWRFGPVSDFPGSTVEFPEAFSLDPEERACSLVVHLLFPYPDLLDLVPLLDLKTHT